MVSGSRASPPSQEVATMTMSTSQRRCGAVLAVLTAVVVVLSGDGRTRRHLRVRRRTSPWWLTPAYQAVLVLADFVMAVGMLRGIERRVEAAAPPRGSG